jgi:hypothetical protein
MALALLVVIPLKRHSANEFTARGAPPAAHPELFVYRMHPLERLEPEPSHAPIHSTEDLAFAYTNPSSSRHLMIFGVDEHSHVYWYYPAWRNESENPRAIEIPGGGEVHELPEAIRHSLDGRTLTIFALFTADDPSVRAVEELLKNRDGANHPLPLPDTYEERLHFTVEP